MLIPLGLVWQDRASSWVGWSGCGAIPVPTAQPRSHPASQTLEQPPWEHGDVWRGNVWSKLESKQWRTCRNTGGSRSTCKPRGLGAHVGAANLSVIPANPPGASEKPPPSGVGASSVAEQSEPHSPCPPAEQRGLRSPGFQVNLQG